jgi:cell division protein FtsB
VQQLEASSLLVTTLSGELKTLRCESASASEQGASWQHELDAASRQLEKMQHQQSEAEQVLQARAVEVACLTEELECLRSKSSKSEVAAKLGATRQAELEAASRQLDSRAEQVSALSKELEKVRKWSWEKIAALEAAHAEEAAMLQQEQGGQLLTASKTLEAGSRLHAMLRKEVATARAMVAARDKRLEEVEHAASQSAAVREHMATRLCHLLGQERLMARVVHAWRLASVASSTERRVAETEVAHAAEREQLQQERQECAAEGQQLETELDPSPKPRSQARVRLAW